MPVYKYPRRGPDAWQIVIYHLGKPTYKLFHGSKAGAEAFEAEERLKLHAGVAPTTQTVPNFSDFLTGRYTPHAQVHLGPRTWKNRTYQLATLAEHFGKLRLDVVADSDTVLGYKKARLSLGIRPATINDELKVLGVVLHYAKDVCKLPIPEPEIQPLPLKGRKRRHAEAWSDEELAKLLETCAELDPEMVALIAFLANTGCRREEAISLKWQNVDLARRQILIWEDGDEFQPKGDHTSEPKNREVPISDALLPWLSGEHVSDTWVFPCRRRERESPGNRVRSIRALAGDFVRFAYWPQRRFDRVRKAAGLTGGPHKLRHTFASIFLRDVPDIQLLAKIMGHSTTRVTELYAHLLPDHLARARNAVCIPAPVTPAEVRAALRWTSRRPKTLTTSRVRPAMGPG
jgi:integrase